MEDSFDIISLFRLLMKHVKIIIFVTIACSIIAYLISALLIPKKYTSTVQLYVENKSTANDNLSSSDITVAQQLVNTCSIIFTSTSVFDQLADDENIDYSANELQSMMTVKSVDGTEVMKITITCYDPKDAEYIAKVACDICISEYERVISTGTIKAIDTPKRSSTASFPNNKKFGIIGLVLGFILSCTIVLLRNLLDTRVKPDDNLAEIYDIPVFAEIMDFENKASLAHAYKYKY